MAENVIFLVLLFCTSVFSSTGIASSWGWWEDPMRGLISQRRGGVCSFFWDTAHWGWTLGLGEVWPSRDGMEFGTSSPSPCSEAVFYISHWADTFVRGWVPHWTCHFCLAFCFPGSSRQDPLRSPGAGWSNPLLILLPLSKRRGSEL